MRPQKGILRNGLKGRGKALAWQRWLETPYLEDLLGDKYLSEIDPPLQTLNPNGGDRTITLNEKKYGQITNNSDGTFGLQIKERVTGAIVLTLSAATGYKSVRFNRQPSGSYQFTIEGGY